MTVTHGDNVIFTLNPGATPRQYPDPTTEAAYREGWYSVIHMGEVTHLGVFEDGVHGLGLGDGTQVQLDDISDIVILGDK